MQLLNTYLPKEDIYMANSYLKRGLILLSIMKCKSKSHLTPMRIVDVVQSLSFVWHYDPTDYSMTSSSILHFVLEFTQIHAHWGGDTI